MFRYLIIAAIIFVSLLTYQLYEVSYNTNDVRRNIRLLKNEIKLEKERINAIEIEIAESLSHQNISRLNNEVLGLKSQDANQFITIEQLPSEKITPLPIEPVAMPQNGLEIVENDDPIGALSLEILDQN